MRGVYFATFLFLMLAVLRPAAAADGMWVQRRDAALMQDAAEYARQFGVSIDEADLRLRAQEKSVKITDALQEQYRSRLAGISIEHKPVYRIVVYLTGDEPVPEQRVKVEGLTMPIVFRTGAKATRERVVWAITYHQAAIRAALPSPPAMGLDPRTGELVVIISRAVAAKEGPDVLKARLEAIAGVPVRISAIDRVDVNLAGDVDGGSRLEGVNPENGKRYYCTTAFAVTDGKHEGITTAAHCLDTLTHYDPQHGATPLQFIGQWGWGYHDVQIHGTTEAMKPYFYADSKKAIVRPVSGSRSRNSTRAGDFVCHRGETTGYSCAQVELIDFAPAGDLCGGPCLPTWVAVSGPTCKAGDSGSPVFLGTTAFGILKGASYRRDGSCSFYFYMSIDYLPPGWKLLEE